VNVFIYLLQEEKSELKAQNFLLEKEKALLVIRLGSKQSQNCEMREGNATSPQLDGDFKKVETSSVRSQSSLALCCPTFLTPRVTQEITSKRTNEFKSRY